MLLFIDSNILIVMSDKEIEEYLENISDQYGRLEINCNQIMNSLGDSSDEVEIKGEIMNNLSGLEDDLIDTNLKMITTRLELEGAENVRTDQCSENLGTNQFNYRFEIGDRKVALEDRSDEFIIEIYNGSTNLANYELDMLNSVNGDASDPYVPEIINRIYEIYDESSKKEYELIEQDRIADPVEVLGIPRLCDLESRGIIKTAKSRNIRNIEDSKHRRYVIESFCGDEELVEKPKHLDSDYEIYAKSILDEEEYTRHNLQGDLVEQVEEVMKIAKMPYHKRRDYEPGEDEGLLNKICGKFS